MSLQITIRLLWRAACTWTSPPVRLLFSIPRLQFSDTKDVGTTLVRVRRLIKYLELCESSFSLVSFLTPALCELLAKIVWQYLIVVYHAFDEWLEAGLSQLTLPSRQAIESGRNKLHEASNSLENLLRRRIPSSQVPLDVDSVLAEGWIAFTIFEPVFAALASRYGPGIGFKERARKEVKVCDWLDAAAPFLPNAVTFDATLCIVGATRAHWDRFHDIEEWEKELRDARFAELIQAMFQDARTALTLVVKEHELADKPALVLHGESAMRLQGLSSFFPNYCRGYVWETIQTPSLDHLDQCSACQVLFTVAALAQPNNPIPWKRLGKWDSERGWQFAEADLLIQIHDYFVALNTVR